MSRTTDGERDAPMDRRTFIGTLAGGLFAAPLGTEAQQGAKIYRSGSISETVTTPPGQGPFHDRMRELGWVYGRDFVTERRAYGEHVERVPDLAAELVQSGADIFLVAGATDARRVQRVTRTIPIVASDAGLLVQSGLAASLARPGGNVTGVQVLGPEMAGKLLAILKEAIPGFSRSGILVVEPGVDDAEIYGLYIREAETIGKTLGIRLRWTAEQIDQILRGARVGEVSIRQVTTFQLKINLKTAKALGLTVPQSLLQRADQVIE